MAHLFILLSCKIDIVCVWISNMDSIEICFQGFTNDVVGLNESIFYCQKIFWQKCYYRKVGSSKTSRLEAHARFFRLLKNGIFDPYVL